ncbi:hypothetical protein GCM10028818_41070 [Spirosoma horti]
MTYEEFQAGLAETPELINEIYEKHEGDFTKHLTDGKKMVVTTMDDYQKTTQTAIDKAIKDGHTAWETKLEKVTGQKRPEGKKGLEWFDELSAKIKYMENADDTESPLYKGLKKELDDLKEERKSEKKELARVKIDGEIKGAVNKLKFAVPSHVKKDDEKTAYQKREIEDATDIFNARYTTTIDDKGRFVYTNKKGEAQTEGGEPMTAEAIFARDFATKLVPDGRSAGGAGSGDDDQHQGGADYLGATTEEIRTKLAEKGLGVGTAKWKEAYEKAHIAAGYVKTDDGYVKQ